MSGFSAEWLALREAADARSRWPDAVARLAGRPELSRPALIVDLGSGTGANCRYLAPRLGRSNGPRHDWLLVDHDAALLAQATAACESLPALRSLRTAELDLAASLQRLPQAGAALLTASALLDLVSESWLAQLAGQCRDAALPALFALSYDGRMQLTPAVPDDDFVRDAVNDHQRRNKGFGPALGPTAVARARALFTACGYDVSSARSDWQLDARDAPLQRALIEGWASAAAELHPDAAERVKRWAQRRLACVDAGSSTLVVGHEDLLALPGPAAAA
jgi:SAM-dependent methyltransferase